MRNARSSLNTGISETVQPQSRVRGSAVEGKLVVVKKGPYVGMMGKFDFMLRCIHTKILSFG